MLLSSSHCCCNSCPQFSSTLLQRHCCSPRLVSLHLILSGASEPSPLPISCSSLPVREASSPAAWTYQQWYKYKDPMLQALHLFFFFAAATASPHPCLHQQWHARATLPASSESTSDTVPGQCLHGLSSPVLYFLFAEVLLVLRE